MLFNTVFINLEQVVHFLLCSWCTLFLYENNDLSNSFYCFSRNAFQKSFELLSGETGTGCQSFIIFITDGQDTDGDKVRCEKGYYTRSGYVPGKKCQYNWNTVWSNVKLWNTRGVCNRT